MNADDVEFLTPKGEAGAADMPAGGYSNAGPVPQGSSFVQVDEEELPF